MRGSDPITVSELTGRIKSTIEGSFNGVSVVGEVSNFKHHTSGHCYFTLKDDQSQIQAVMWRSRVAGLSFQPDNGMRVVASGNVTVFPVRGVYQIDVMRLTAAGEGELQAAFERLKRKLEAEGLFDPGRKKPLPRYPRRIGIVTSPTGAAIRDLLNVFGRRAPYLEIVLVPVLVQGSGAAAEIAGAIDALNNFKGAIGIDLMIVGRGGGSVEDLWAFNEETVARAIHRSEIPVVSAVGHETDFTISDFVADLRAPTPSAAAEMAAPDRGELVEIIGNYMYTGKQSLDRRISTYRDRIAGYIRSHALNRPLDIVRQYAQQLDDIESALGRIVAHRIALSRERVLAHSRHLQNLNPEAILGRGYVIVNRGGIPVVRAAGVKRDDTLELRFSDGSVAARALDGAVPKKRGTKAGGLP